MREEKQVLLALGGLAITKLGLSWLALRTKLSSRQLVGYVSKIFVYPVKSCGAVSLTTAEVSTYGLASADFEDRSWLITDENYNFITARKYPKIQLIKPTIDGDTLSLNAPGVDPFTLPLRQEMDKKKVHLCRIWSQKSEGVDCGDGVANWLSNYLEVKVRLVKTISSIKKRALVEDPQLGHLFLTGTEVNFPDLSPVNMLSEAAVDVLKAKVPDKDVTHRNFRPNIVIEGCDAHAEDTWDKVFIGDAQFSGVKLCERCLMTTINPDRGVKDEDGQPLKELRRYRQRPELGYGNEVCFAADFAIDRKGTLKVGDPIYAVLGTGLSVPRA